MGKKIAFDHVNHLTVSFRCHMSDATWTLYIVPQVFQ